MKALNGLLDTHGPTVPLGQVVVLLRADRLELPSLSRNFWETLGKRKQHNLNETNFGQFDCLVIRSNGQTRDSSSTRTLGRRPPCVCLSCSCAGSFALERQEAVPRVFTEVLRSGGSFPLERQETVLRAFNSV